MVGGEALSFSQSQLQLQDAPPQFQPQSFAPFLVYRRQAKVMCPQQVQSIYMRLMYMLYLYVLVNHGECCVLLGFTPQFSWAWLRLAEAYGVLDDSPLAVFPHL